MPIHYVCVACREEVYLPDSKAGTLQGCPRCRLKFLAPAPNVTVVPTPGAAQPAPAVARPQPQTPPSARQPAPQTAGPPGSTSRPSFAGAMPARAPAPVPAGARPMPASPTAARPPGTAPQAAPPVAAPPPKPASPPPVYPRDAVKPPLYPLEGQKPAAKPAPAPAAAKPPAKVNKETAIFGLHTGEVPALFGGDDEEQPGELFADAIPSSPDHGGDDDLDIPIDVKRSPTSAVASGPSALESSDLDEEEESAADEGGGVAVPEESDAIAAIAAGLDDGGRLATEPSLPLPPSEDATEANVEGLADSDALISMDDLFSAKPGAVAKPAAQAKPAPAATVPFGTGGVLPAPFLKPASPAPHATPTPAPATGGGARPFTLIAVEGVTDGPFNLSGGEVYLLGRDKDAQVKILSTSVSRRHARIDATGGDHVLIDLGSANGTQVNGTSVARHPLKDGDIIRMGKVLLRYTPT